MKFFLITETAIYRCGLRAILEDVQTFTWNLLVCASVGAGACQISVWETIT